jgi:hypothetical protein
LIAGISRLFGELTYEFAAGSQQTPSPDRIAVALEMRRRGHTPVLAVPEIFCATVERLGLEFAKVGPRINPTIAMALSILPSTLTQPTDRRSFGQLFVRA